MALSNSYGEGEVKTWKLVNSFVFTFSEAKENWECFMRCPIADLGIIVVYTNVAHKQLNRKYEEWCRTTMKIKAGTWWCRFIFKQLKKKKKEKKKKFLSI